MKLIFCSEKGIKMRTTASKFERGISSKDWRIDEIKGRSGGEELVGVDRTM